MVKRLWAPLGLVAAAAIAVAPPALAAPSLTPAQVYALFAAAGFPVGPDKHPVNRCGERANPKVTFVDMNGDGRLEALFIDAGSCYKPDGRWFALTTQGPDGQWRQILEGEGTLSATGTAYGHWFVLTASGSGKAVRLHYNGQTYVAANGQPLGTATAPAPAAPAPATPATAAPATAANTGTPVAQNRVSGPDAAIFLAAGLKQVHGHWESGCNDGNTDRNDPYQPATITDRKDLNGDGRPDAVISESGVFCYGNTGQAFWIVAQEANGSWKRMINEVGIPEFRKTKGVDGWPDILIGGPGMCFPIVRWNGAAYKVVGFNDGDKPCKPMG